MRHLRSPIIWVLAIAGPLAARFLVPEEGSDYTLLYVNDASLLQTPSVIGLQLGVITAVLLAPLAYIFLKAGPTRQQPFQVTDVLPSHRPALSLGRWIGDTLALWLLLLILALAGVLLSFFRLPLSDVSAVETVLAAVLVAAPALSIIAAVRTVLSMRPRLRRALGDVAFFFFWMFALILSAGFFMDGSAGSPFADLFGFAAPLASGTDETVTEIVIGGSPSSDRVMVFDGMAGVLDGAYLMSRLFWLGMAALVALLSGFLFKGSVIRPSKVTPGRSLGAPVFSGSRLDPVSPQGGSNAIAKVMAFANELVPNRLWLAAIGVIALAGAVLPLRGMVGPALVLALIFPLTVYGARWRAPSVVAWLTTLPTPAAQRTGWQLLVAIGFCLVLLIPSVIGLKASEWADVLAIGVGLPAIAVGLGHLTRSPVAARLLLLILWYGYLNMGPV